ncbi:MAG: class II aldolase/adducin family protein [Caldilineales bacterium]|nr:class II aldolase/adducin family protein [Caldilineales bacterium]
MNFKLLHPRDQLVAIMNRIYHSGMTTLSGGNLSILEANGDMWITPSGIDKGKLTPRDIMLVRADGVIVGPHKPSVEYPFHRAIYACRPDLGAIVHAHAPALVSFSIARKIPSTNIIPQARRICGLVGYAPYALPGSEQLGRNIADTFADGYNVVLLENHGVATGGEDLLTAFQRLETLDFCARTELRAQGLGPVNTLSEEQLLPFDVQYNLLPEFDLETHSSRERELRQQLIEIVRRAVDRYLMISTEGVASARMNKHEFLITPTGLDRGNLDISDLVLIRDMQRERGKLPSRSVRLHRAIYDTHPDINSVITAQSPNILAYAISHGRFDTRTIPESYILLRDIPLVPYGTQFKQPQQIADAISAATPVLFIQNDAVMTTGTTILQAFDRLEVAEYSAKSLLDTATIGPMVPIGPMEIDELAQAFL